MVGNTEGFVATNTEGFVATKTQKEATKVVATKNEIVATKNNEFTRRLMSDLTPNDKTILNSFKKDKGLIDADISHFINEHGKELSIKKRIVRKYRDFKANFDTYKTRFPSDYVEFIEKQYLPEIYAFVVVFEKELKDLVSEDQKEFDFVIKGERVG